MERVRLCAVALEWRCIVVDRQCRESEGKAKIEGYMSVSDEEAHHHDSSTYERVQPDWVHGHFARWNINTTHMVTVSLNRVSFLSSSTHFILTNFAGLMWSLNSCLPIWYFVYIFAAPSLPLCTLYLAQISSSNRFVEGHLHEKYTYSCSAQSVGIQCAISGRWAGNTYNLCFHLKCKLWV